MQSFEGLEESIQEGQSREEEWDLKKKAIEGDLVNGGVFQWVLPGF